MQLVGDQRGIGPGRLAVGAPVPPERPSWQRLARIPLALSHVHEAVRAVALLHQAPAARWRGRAWSVRARRCSTRRPRGRCRHERRLAAHGQADVAGGEVGVDRAPARENLSAIASSVYGLVTRGDSKIALHRHLVGELDARTAPRRRRSAPRWMARACTPAGCALRRRTVRRSGRGRSSRRLADTTSHQAWRSVKSWLAPAAAPASAFTSGTS